MRLLAGCVLSLVASAAAQRGDKAGEEQPPLPASLVLPDAAPRSPAEESASFRLAPGFAIALFAAEPLVGDPVAAAFDAAGRLWVVEMRGYMNDLDAKSEREPNGRVVVLTDDDRDGVADRASVFADGLVLPRAVLPLRGGALVVAPPELLWLPDADGDQRADRREVVMAGFEAGIENPEHSGNGLLWGFDHRIHLANDRRMLRRTADGFAIEDGAGGGQWGITHDDRGRLYFNYNEDWLRCDLVPGRYGPRAQATGGLPLLNHEVSDARSVWPIRKTPGVNRGYQPGRLVDWMLAIRTAVCAPHVYRGGLLPADGDVFVCEPAGNVVRRFGLRDGDGLLRGANVYESERAEFLASTDERFRPVNLLTGPDGALYVVDMYRGVIQHKNFVTTFLRQQIVARGLERPIGLGRIWRVTAAGAAPVPPPPLDGAPGPALVAAMASTNGAVRDVALRELVQAQAQDLAEPLRARLAADARPSVRIALLSALAGLQCLTATDLRAALRDDDPGVLAMALQHVAPALGTGDPHLWLQLERLRRLPADAVWWQLALALGDVLGLPARPAVHDRALALLAELVLDHPGDAALRACAAAAAGPVRLVALLAQLTARHAPDEVVRDLAGRAAKTRQAAVVDALLRLATEPAAARVLLGGLRDGLPRGAGRTGSLLLTDPAPLAKLARAGDAELTALAQELLAAAFVQGTAAAAEVAQLTAAEQQRVREGERVFARSCASCHQLDGRGMPGLAPPLRDSEWVLGAPDRLVRIALHGVRGAIEVQGTTWMLEMPGQRHLADDELAAVLSYVRRAFDHRASVLQAADIAAMRALHPARTEPWTAADLLGGK